MSKLSSSPKVVPYFVHRRSTSQSSDDFGAEGAGTPGYLVSTPSESKLGVYGSEDEVVDMLPPGASADEFGPRTVMQAIPETEEQSKGGSTFSRDDDTNYTGPDAPVGSLLLQRKVPVKVDPKTFFANERTLLLWLHSALWLFAGASTIIKFSNEDPLAELYGVMLLPIALAFTTYALFQHARRVRMIRVKHPGPYEDLLGPALLGIALMTAIVAQFSLKLYSVWYY
mmetsp:Transcript_20030/g.43163  ORF Transcript_20030/g.43163 Transcript_20030/m.43163 type:complete len:227 (+) Transcript_20030:92-772(+)